MKWIRFSLLIVCIGCGTSYIQDVVTIDGTVLEIDSARFEFPDSAVMDSLVIEIEQHSIPQKTYTQGYTNTGIVFTIEPFELGIEKPVKFSLPVKSSDLILGAKIGKGFVPLVASCVEGETLHAQLWHGGEYYVIQKPDTFGIIEHADADSALLVVTDPYVSDYVDRFKYILDKKGYGYPVWVFVYDPDKSIEENAFFLNDELHRLHEEYGNFRLDIVGFGLGGLVFHRYVADTLLYQSDVSSAVVAVGTPFYGTSYTDVDNINSGKSPYRHFYHDALIGLDILDTESEFMSWIRQNRGFAGQYRDDSDENKHFTSIRGRHVFKGTFPEETEGDGLVSLQSGRFTPIEPEPLLLDHFMLYDDQTSHQFITDFVRLYRTFSWPSVFKKVWRDELMIDTVCSIWMKEALLLYGDYGVDLLLHGNENMLKSTPENAILITNGDNDTYPAWYLQEKGIRNDVTIVNRSLFNLPDYVVYLQRHKDLPLELSLEEIKAIKPYKENGKPIYVSDQLIKLIVEKGDKSVVFSTTVYEPEKYSYPLTLVGVVYEIGEGDFQIRENKYLDVEKTWQLFTKEFNLHELPYMDTVSSDIRHLYSSYAAVLLQLNHAYTEQGKYDLALDAIDRAHQFNPHDEVFTSALLFNEAKTYLEMGQQEKVDSLFAMVLEKPGTVVSYKKGIAEIYFEQGRVADAIKILADCLKEEPENEEVLDLIKKYQGEL